MLPTETMAGRQSRWGGGPSGRVNAGESGEERRKSEGESQSIGGETESPGNWAEGMAGRT
jgi:hypothetical protein